MAPSKGGKNSCKRACKTPGLVAGTPGPVSPLRAAQAGKSSSDLKCSCSLKPATEPPAAAQCFLRAACEGRGASHLLQWSRGVVPVECNNMDEQRKTATFSDRAFLGILVGVALLQDRL